MSKKLIFLPYACDPRKNTGVNLSRRAKAFEIYCKNFCVALVSLKKENQDCDVALVTNTEIPEVYASILRSNHIMILRVPYEEFQFPEDYRWSLAFYKLCALSAMVGRGEYDYYCYMDTDIIANCPMDAVWKECDRHIMLYDVNHGLHVSDYTGFLDEVERFLGRQDYITHYGGEFFAANRENAGVFVAECRSVYEKMMTDHFETTKGDEFIVSIAAENRKPLVKNAGAYIFRFWTGSYRLISTSYKVDPVAILHMPAEKERGMIAIFDHYISKGRYPTRGRIYRLCHISRPRLKNVIRNLIKGVPHQ